ncbi:MAG TPA: hypothetical protein GX708_11300 [Gallicola sp.]|nr:hypothetical protein [Gallicola sp.]
MAFIVKLKLNLKAILTLFLKISGSIFSFIAIIVTFVNIEEIGLFKIGEKILLLFAVAVFSFILSLILVLFIFKKNRIWSNGKNKVFASYGDIIKYGFMTKEKNKKIVVIPVNDTFDTIIEKGGETVINPLVSLNTIHGKWIDIFCNKNSCSNIDLNLRIQENLKLHKQKPIKTLDENEKPRGNREKYELGTVAIIESGNTIFYLLAISEFNEKNNAQSDKIKIRKAVEMLIEFYDQNGQGYPLFMPLFGTGSSRAKLSHKQSLKIIKSSIFAFEEKINGQINVIVYYRDRDKISIFD